MYSKVTYTVFLILFALTPSTTNGQSSSLASFQEGTALKLRALENPNSQMGFDGVGFTIKVDSAYYIVTNRHIIEEKDYYTKISNGLKNINFISCTSISYLNYQVRNILIRKDSTELFFGCKYDSNLTDIVAIPVGANAIGLNQALNYELDYKLKNGDEVFVISILRTAGGIGTFTMFSKIISDPTRDCRTEFGVLPVVLIERASLPGMSGSPVFVWPKRKKSPIFVGVLAGNNGANAFFWRKDILNELVKSIKSSAPNRKE